METYRKFTDEHLADLLKTGDKFAYSEIYDRYKASLFSFSYRRLEDIAESEDVVAELFLTLWDRHAMRPQPQMKRINTDVKFVLICAHLWQQKLKFPGFE